MTAREPVVLERATSPAEKVWLTPREAAEYLTHLFGRKFGVRSVQAFCQRGTLPHALVGNRVLIRRDDLISWINRRGGTVGADA